MWMAGALGQILRHDLWEAASIHKHAGLAAFCGVTPQITSSPALAP